MVDALRYTTEFLAIGGGVIGSAIAYHLARAGQTVLVVERDAPATSPAASWASAGGVCRQGRDEREAALAEPGSRARRRSALPPGGPAPGGGNRGRSRAT